MLKIELTGDAPGSLDAEVLAVPFSGALSPALAALDGALNGGLTRLAASEANAKPGLAAVLATDPRDPVAARRIALVGIGTPDETDEDAVRTAAAAALRTVRGIGGTVAWLFAADLSLSAERQVRAVVEGALLGDHDPARWRTSVPARRAERLLIVGAPEGLETVARRAETVAGWTNRARELVDAPANEITPGGLARAAVGLLEGLPVDVEVQEPDELARTGLPMLLQVGQGSVNGPRLIVARYNAGPPGGKLLALVGKGVTFDSGGFFLKSQDDIVRQKADMGGGAAVIAALGAIAELRLPLDVLALVPAAENMLGGGAFRPGDILTTAAGLTVEITNPDAEGRLLLADGLWYAQKQGATHLVDIATLTGAMRGGMGDMYTGVFANDPEWRGQVVAAGDESGDHAWPWPLSRRYRRLLDSRLADLRNTAGRSFGYPIIAASFLERFVGDLPWAHVDIHSTSFLDEERDYLQPGATGAGVRLLVELASRLS